MSDELRELLDNIAQRLQSPPVSAERSATLHAALQRHFGYETFRPQQESIISALLDGHTVLAILPTGLGKSLCYQLPALLLEGVTIVVSPLIALMKDQADQLQARGHTSVAFLNSSLSLAAQRREMARTRDGQVKLLYVAPERFRSRAFTAELARQRLSLFVIDEAHCVSQWGHDFRPAYLALQETLRVLQPAAIALFTATATPEVEEDLLRQLGLARVEKFAGSIARNNLRFRVIKVPSETEKFRQLAALAGALEGKGIVYASRRREAEEIAALLQHLGMRADYYHAGRDDEDRRRIQEQFFDDSPAGLRVVAATNAFGLGIDKQNLRFVIHFSMPGSLEAYYQEAGRAGRDGSPADCILLYHDKDLGLQKWFIKNDRLMKSDLQRLLITVENSVAFDNSRMLDPAELERQTGLTSTRLRVGLSVLQRLGFVRQYPHVCRELRVSPQSGSAISSKLVQFLNRTGGRILTPEFCREYKIAPNELMARLYDAQWRGELRFSGIEDGWLVDCLRPAAELAAVTETQLGLDDWERQKQRRLEQLQLYALSHGCREALLRRYFGEQVAAAPSCGRCDNCDPAQHLTVSAPGTAIAVEQFLQQREPPAHS